MVLARRKVLAAFNDLNRDLRGWVEAPIGAPTGESDAPDIYEEFYED